MNEIWRKVPDFSMYEVSSEGRIRSYRTRSGVPRILSPYSNRLGYFYVTLIDDVGNTRVGTLHAHVARAFLGPRPDGHCTRHLDGNPSNNRVSNLRYGTNGENQDDSVRHGTHAEARKTACERGHEFTAANTRIELLDGGRTKRHCRSCQRERDIRRGARPH